MAIDRFSSDVHARFGAKKRFRNLDSKLQATFEDGIGSERAIEAAEILLGTTGYVPGSISKDAFYTTRSYFLNKGVAEVTADSLTLLLIDAARVLEVTPQLLAYQLSKNEGVLFELETYVALNFFRPPTDQLMVLLENDNSASFRNRNVIP